MAKAYHRSKWNHTSELLAMMARLWSDGSFTAGDFHPDTIRERAAAARVSSFSARYYAIRLCGPKAAKLFEEHDRQIAKGIACQTQVTSEQEGHTSKSSPKTKASNKTSSNRHANS